MNLLPTLLIIVINNCKPVSIKTTHFKTSIKLLKNGEPFSKIVLRQYNT